MKIKHLVFAAFLMFMPALTYSQVKVDVKKKLVQKTNKESNQAVDKKIDEGFNKIKGLFGKKKKKTNTSQTQTTQQETNQGQNQSQAASQPVSAAKPELKWAKYDFVPGDKVIFEDNLTGEENGEFPSRWDLVRGNVENAMFGGDNVIMFRDGQPMIVPYMKNPDRDYLPEVFTIEFDLYLPEDADPLTVYFYDRKNQNSPSGSRYLNVWPKQMVFGAAKSALPNEGSVSNRWAHIAIAYTNGKLKAYVDETRLINIPHLGFNPSGISLHAYHAHNTSLYYVKNFRLAKGGVKYYDRFMQDGKIVANGIRFQTGKANILPESMGIINEIYSMMAEHKDIRVSVEGHTDNVGDDSMNQALSEKRAEAVKSKLESMGIDASRFVSKGWGESKPIADNSTPEGRANNRRVEFVKL